MVTLQLSFEDVRVLQSALDVYRGTLVFALESPENDEEEHENNAEMDAVEFVQWTISQAMVEVK